MEAQISPKEGKNLETKQIDTSTLDIAVALSSLGVKLKDWDGTDIDFIAPSMKKAIDSCKLSFEQNSNPDMLLCALLIQLGVSNALTKAVMGNLFKMKSVDPIVTKASIERLGVEIIDLSTVVKNKKEFSSKLQLLLAFAYSNDLIPGFSKSQ